MRVPKLVPILRTELMVVVSAWFAILGVITLGVTIGLILVRPAGLILV